MGTRAGAVMATFVATAVLAIAGPRAQTPPQPAATGLIMGRVVDGTTERPVAAVIVTLTSGSAAAPPSRVITDSGGRFLFHDLPPGRYSFSVTGASPVIGGG